MAETTTVDPAEFKAALKAALKAKLKAKAKSKKTKLVGIAQALSLKLGDLDSLTSQSPQA
jgi:hypothetical protein